jgi:hypothetical protein
MRNRNNWKFLSKKKFKSHFTPENPILGRKRENHQFFSPPADMPYRSTSKFSGNFQIFIDFSPRLQKNYSGVGLV